MNQKRDTVDEANQRLRNALSQLKEARQIQKVLMGLGKELSLGCSQEEFLQIVVEAVKSLFPTGHYLVQLVDPRDLTLTAVDCHGPICGDHKNRVHLSQSALIKTHLDPTIVNSPNVSVYEEVPIVFKGSTYAIHAPLVCDNQLFGAIQLEGPEEVPLGDDDEVLLISLANQMSLALRNQRLLEEMAFLKDYLESILEFANALIIVTNKNRQILVYNRAIEKQLGFPKDQTLGTDLFMWLPREEHERFSNEISRIINDAQAPAGGMEANMRNRDGELVQVLFHLAALRGPTGEVGSVIMVGQDITRIRSLESQIIESEKMASLGKLAAGVVHELNNPLTSISVYADFLAKKLAEDKLDQSDIEKLEKIMQGAKRIQKLTKDLISYAKPASDRPEAIQFNDLITQALGFCEHDIQKYDIRIHTDFHGSLRKVFCKRNQLLQIVINLITNACQAMEGGGELTLSTKTSNDKDLVLQISDTGSGISKKDLENIFEPFYTTKKNGEGTGLGLSIVSRIVEHHRGNIAVESTPGVGTTITIQLPYGNHDSNIQKVQVQSGRNKTM